MRYTITGILSGYPNRSGNRTLTWEDGKLSGDPLAILLVEGEAGKMEGRTVGPPEGPYTDGDHIKDPLSTLMLLTPLFVPGYTVVGDLPIRGDVDPLGRS
jgi:hypothetical protein